MRECYEITRSQLMAVTAILTDLEVELRPEGKVIEITDGDLDTIRC